MPTTKIGWKDSPWRQPGLGFERPRRVDQHAVMGDELDVGARSEGRTGGFDDRCLQVIRHKLDQQGRDPAEDANAWTLSVVT